MIKSFVFNSKRGGKPDPLTIGNIFSLIVTCVGNAQRGVLKTFMPCFSTGHRLFTVPYFFVRSFRYTASYRHGYLDFQMYRGGGRRGL